jgi:ankyrin repeat protein
LAVASSNGHLELLSLLLDEGAVVQPDAIVRSAKAGHIHIVELLLSKFKCPQGLSILHYASLMDGFYGELLHEALPVILGAGASKEIEQNSNDGNSPLTFAVGRGCPKIAEILLAAGADPARRHANDTLRSPLFETRDEGLARMLLDAGAAKVINQADCSGQTVLMNAAAARGDAGQPSLVALLLDRKADPTPADHAGMTALMHAADAGNAESVRLLLAAGAAPTVDQRERDDDKTALLLAINAQARPVMQMLVDARADVNACTREGIGALAGLCWRPQPDADAVRMLLGAGADADATDRFGCNALFSAILHTSVEILGLLVAAGADPLMVSDRGLTTPMIATMRSDDDADITMAVIEHVSQHLVEGGDHAVKKNRIK